MGQQWMHGYEQACLNVEKNVGALSTYTSLQTINI